MNKLIIGGVVAAAIGLTLLGFSLGTKSSIGFDLSAGQATVLKAEGRKALDEANAAAIEANTARANADAMQVLATKKQTDMQWVTMLAKWTIAGVWAGGGLIVIGAIIIVYFFGHGAWITNDQRCRAPIVHQHGTMTITMTNGITVWHDRLVPGLTVYCDRDSVFGIISPSDVVLLNSTTANTIREALIKEGYNSRSAAKAVSNIVQAMRNAQPTRFIEASVV